MKMMKPQLKRKVEVAEDCFQTNDVQVRATSMNDLLRHRVGQRQSQEVRSVLGGNPLGTGDRTRRRSLWKAFTIDSLETSTLMQNALVLSQVDQVHSEEPKNYSRLKAMVPDVLEDQQQNSFKAQKKGRVKDKAIPVAPMKKAAGNEGDCKQWSSRGSCSRGAKCAFKHDDQRRGKGNGDKRLRRKRQPTPKPEVSEKKVDLLLSITRMVAVHRTRICDYWHPPFCVLHKTRQCRSDTNIGKDDRPPSPTRQQKTDTKDSNMIPKSKAGGNSLQGIPKWRNSMPRRTSSVERHQDPTSQPIGQLAT